MVNAKNLTLGIIHVIFAFGGKCGRYAKVTQFFFHYVNTLNTGF